MNSGPTLKTGSRGPDVRRLQRILVMMKQLDPIGIDGVFGEMTRLAVEAFQEGAGLAVDGIAGPLPWAALPADPNTPQVGAGAHGPVVSALQQALQSFGGPGASTDPGGVDGIFGPRTTAAVRAYQGDIGVGVDGIVGDQTWSVPLHAAGATLESTVGLQYVVD